MSKIHNWNPLLGSPEEEFRALNATDNLIEIQMFCGRILVPIGGL